MVQKVCGSVIIIAMVLAVFPLQAAGLSLSLMEGFSLLARKQIFHAHHLQIQGAQEGVLQEKSAYYPQLRLEASTSWTRQIRKQTSLDPELPEPFTSLGDSLFNSDSQSTAQQGALKLTQMLFDNGITDYQIQLAQISVGLEQIQADAELHHLKSQFIDMYFDWFKLKNTIEIQKKQLKLSQKEYAEIARLYVPNSAGHIVAREKELAMDRAAYALARSESELVALRGQIQVLLEIPTSQHISLKAPDPGQVPKVTILEKKDVVPLVKKFKTEALAAQVRSKLASSLSQYRIDLDGLATMDSYGSTATYGAFVLRWALLDGGKIDRQRQAFAYAEKAAEVSAQVAAKNTEERVQEDLQMLSLKRRELDFLKKEQDIAGLKLAHARAQLQKKLLLPIDVEKAQFQMDVATLAIQNVVLDMQKQEAFMALKLCRI